MRVSCLQCYKSGKVLVSKCAESRLLSGLPKKKQQKKKTKSRLREIAIRSHACKYLFTPPYFFGKSMTTELLIVDGLAKILIIADQYQYDEIV